MTDMKIKPRRNQIPSHISESLPSLADNIFPSSSQTVYLPLLIQEQHKQAVTWTTYSYKWSALTQVFIFCTTKFEWFQWSLVWSEHELLLEIIWKNSTSLVQLGLWNYTRPCTSTDQFLTMLKTQTNTHVAWSPSYTLVTNQNPFSNFDDYPFKIYYSDNNIMYFYILDYFYYNNFNHLSNQFFLSF